MAATPIFSNINDLKKYIESKQGQNKILDEKQIVRILKEAGKTLERYIRDELNKYFDSYEPKEYTRTGYTLESIRVGEPKKININEWMLEITFDDNLANHPSYIDQSQPDGYTPWLLEVGWNIEDKVGFSRPMFTNHVGTHYITKAVNKFNANNTHGLIVTVQHNGQRYI